MPRDRGREEMLREGEEERRGREMSGEEEEIRGRTEEL